MLHTPVGKIETKADIWVILRGDNTYSGTVAARLLCTSESSEGLKPRFLGPTQESLTDLGKGPRIVISNESPDDADTAGDGAPHFENHCCRNKCLKHDAGPATSEFKSCAEPRKKILE